MHVWVKGQLYPTTVNKLEVINKSLQVPLEMSLMRNAKWMCEDQHCLKVQRFALDKKVPVCTMVLFLTKSTGNVTKPEH